MTAVVRHVQSARRLLVLVSTLPLIGQRAAGCFAAPGIWAQAVETPEGFLGNLTPVMDSIQQERGYAFDYEHKGSLSTEEWRKRGRDAAEKALSYDPKPSPLDLQVHRTTKANGYELRGISLAFAHPAEIRAVLFVLL